MPKNTNISAKLNPATSEILIYDMIYDFAENSLQFSQDITSLAMKNKSVVIRINSDGGNVYQGKGMIAAVEQVKASGREVVMKIDGIAASMAAILAMTGTKVIMKSYSRLMFHESGGSVSGNSADLRTIADEMDTINGEFAAIIAKKAGITAEDARKKYLIKGVDTYVTAEQALKDGLIDEIESDVSMVAPGNLTSAKAYYDYYAPKYSIAAVLNNQPNKYKMKKELLNKLGLAEGASDDAIDAVVEKVLTQRDSLQSSIAAANKKATEDMVDEAIAQNRTTADKRDSLIAAFTGNLEGLKLALSLMPVQAKPTEMINQSAANVTAAASTPAATTNIDASLTGAKKFEAVYAQGAAAIEKWRNENWADYAACYQQKYGRTPEAMSVRK